MSSPAIHQCQCPECRSGQPHKDRDYHHQINLLLSRMSEQQRRWFLALEALRNGHGGKQLLTPDCRNQSDHDPARLRRTACRSGGA